MQEKHLKSYYEQINRRRMSQSRCYLFRSWSPERRTRWIAVSTWICIPCLSLRSVGGKNTAISLGWCTGSHQLFAVRLANTIICRFERDALFSLSFVFQLHIYFVFLNRKWDLSDEKFTKIWPMENSGFCDRICWIPRSVYGKFDLQDVFLVYHILLRWLLFFTTLSAVRNFGICLFFALKNTLTYSNFGCKIAEWLRT